LPGSPHEAPRRDDPNPLFDRSHPENADGARTRRRERQETATKPSEPDRSNQSLRQCQSVTLRSRPTAVQTQERRNESFERRSPARELVRHRDVCICLPARRRCGLVYRRSTGSPGSPRYGFYSTPLT
jgi:hypothetical protein